MKLAAPLMDERALGRFLSKCQVSPTGCVIWTGALNSSSYGTFGLCRRQFQAHRVAYELAVGDLKEGLAIDHLCRNRACVNPSHLEQVTNVENIRRGVNQTGLALRTNRCRWGHPLTGDNVRVNAKGHRICKACRKRYQAGYTRQWREARRLRRVAEEEAIRRLIDAHPDEFEAFVQAALVTNEERSPAA